MDLQEIVCIINVMLLDILWSSEQRKGMLSRSKKIRSNYIKAGYPMVLGR